MWTATQAQTFEDLGVTLGAILRTITP